MQTRLSPTQSRRHFSRSRLAAPATTIWLTRVLERARSNYMVGVIATRARGRFYDKQAGKCHLRLSEPSCLAWCHPPSCATSPRTLFLLTTSRVAGLAGFAGEMFAGKIRPLGVQSAAASRQSAGPVPLLPSSNQPSPLKLQSPFMRCDFADARATFVLYPG